MPQEGWPALGRCRRREGACPQRVGAGEAAGGGGERTRGQGCPRKEPVGAEASQGPWEESQKLGPQSPRQRPRPSPWAQAASRPHLPIYRRGCGNQGGLAGIPGGSSAGGAARGSAGSLPAPSSPSEGRTGRGHYDWARGRAGLKAVAQAKGALFLSGPPSPYPGGERACLPGPQTLSSSGA
uniref:Uncharacterized protein n=1 Tax=Myotis myotis TaxID=51298 RepID=A0A7J7Z5D5_MYOMY|nr:hypothetical protein mMyoMyo1_010785 [Myotis myotis]